MTKTASYLDLKYPFFLVALEKAKENIENKNK